MSVRKFIWFVLLIAILISQYTSQSKKDNKKNKKKLEKWEQYKQKFNKTYANPAEQKKRKQIFNQNRRKIRQKVNNTQAGISIHSDMTQEQFQSTYLSGLISNTPPPTIVQTSSDPYLQNPDPSLVGADAVIPSQFDWRNRSVVTSVKNQGGCGSCWAFATTAVTESWAILKNMTNTSIDLSEQFFLECTKYACSGGALQTSMDKVISDNGIPSQIDFPYQYKLNHTGICTATKAVAAPAPFAVIRYNIVNDDQIINLLMNGPMVVSLSASSWGTYNPSIKKVHTCLPTETSLNHAVTLVGYTNQSWIIKNSWGASWGLNGYMHINRSRGNYQNCLMGKNVFTFADSCNITYCSVCKTRSLSCSVCNDGYYTNYNSTSSLTTCKACIDSNCLTCYSSNYAAPYPGVCRLCKLGWSLDYSTDPLKGGRLCHNISVKNCKSFWFSSTNKTLCAQCDPGYIRNSGYNFCILCNVSNCVTCQVNYGNKCATCKTGYYGPTCTPNCTLNCAAGCLAPFVCSQCDTGYSGSDCSIVSCNVNNCDLGCTTPDICDTCDAGFSGPQCTAIQAPGTVSAQSPSSSCDSDVINCDQGCSSNSGVCDQCNEGFYGNKCNFNQVKLDKCQICLAIAYAKIESGSIQAITQSVSSQTSDGPKKVNAALGSEAAQDNQDSLIEGQKTITSLKWALGIVSCLLGVMTVCCIILAKKAKIVSFGGVKLHQMHGSEDLSNKSELHHHPSVNSQKP